MRRQTILCPRFYINVDQEKNPGTVVLMIAEKYMVLEDAVLELDNDNYIIIDRHKTELSITFKKGSVVEKKLLMRDVLRGKEYISAKPLLPDIWNIDKDKRKNIIAQVKKNMLAELIGKELPVTDLVKLDIVLEQYGIEEDRTSLFLPISSSYIVRQMKFA